MSDTVETIELTTADMIEIVSSGGNGAEYVDVPSLLGQAAQELRALRAENERLQSERDEALAKVKVLEEVADCACAIDHATDECVYHCKIKAKARAKAIEEAAAVVTEHYQSLCQEHRLLLVNRANAILALKTRPE
jgi:cell division septum initiation protein DivIVA